MNGIACIAVALALITDPEPFELPEGGGSAPGLYAAVQAVSFRLELACHRETWQPNLAIEVRVLRSRYVEYADLPRIAEGYWLPPPDVCRENACLSATMAGHLRARMGFNLQWDELAGETAEQLDRSRYVWCQAGLVGNAESFLVQRRCALGYLRDALGRELWAAQRMPAVVPSEALDLLRD